MPLTADNVRVALTGASYVAPLGTALPTAPNGAWPSGWVDLGWLSEDGITETYDDDTTELKGWQGGATVRTLISGSSATFAFTCIETSSATLELYHKGANVSRDGGSGVARLDVGTPGADVREFGFDVIDGDNHLRLIIARGEVTERGEITYKADETIAYPLTITAYPDANGIVVSKLSDSAAWV